MNANTLTWSVLIVAACGAGWRWLQRDAEVERRSEHLREHASMLADRTPTEPSLAGSTFAAGAPLVASEGPDVPSGARATFHPTAVPSHTSESIDVEAFWRDAGPVEAERLEPLLAELETRLELFSAMCAKLGSANRTLDQSSAPATEEFFSQYAGVALAETQFLIDECVAGRVRIAPFTPLPPSVLGSTDATVQLVPHLAAAGGFAYIARLERSEHPTLFEQRRNVNSLAQLVSLGDGAQRTTAAQ